MANEMREEIAILLKGIDRYNPDNLSFLENYVFLTTSENTYDLEAYLAILKLYQFSPINFKLDVVVTILLKAITNLPHTDFTLCKCFIDSARLEEEPLIDILNIADLLDTCKFEIFWETLDSISNMTISIVGFEDSIRKFICHVVGITYQMIKKNTLRSLLGGISESQVNQWIAKYDWKDKGDGYVFIANQEDNIKTKNITEKITFDGIAAIIQSSSTN